MHHSAHLLKHNLLNVNEDIKREGEKEVDVAVVICNESKYLWGERNAAPLDVNQH
jgi:hypothetical protein